MYGEVDPESFATQVLAKLAKLKAGDTFVDVGSGVGKASRSKPHCLAGVCAGT